MILIKIELKSLHYRTSKMAYWPIEHVQAMGRVRRGDTTVTSAVARQKSLTEAIIAHLKRGDDLPDALARETDILGDPILVYVHSTFIFSGGYAMEKCRLIDYAYRHQPEILPQLVDRASVADLEQLLRYGVDIGQNRSSIGNRIIKVRESSKSTLDEMWLLSQHGAPFDHITINNLLLTTIRYPNVSGQIYGLISRLLALAPDVKTDTKDLGEPGFGYPGFAKENTLVQTNRYFWWLARRYPHLWSVVPGREKEESVDKDVRGSLEDAFGRDMTGYVMAWT